MRALKLIRYKNVTGQFQEERVQLKLKIENKHCRLISSQCLI